MLQNIRDRARGWIFSVIISLLVLAFAFWGVERFFQGSGHAKVAITVAGHKITTAELNSAYQRLRRRLQLQQGDKFELTPTLEQQLKQQAKQQLIYNYVLTQAAIKAGFRVTSEQIDAVLERIPMFQANGGFSAARFHAVLNTLFYSQEAFINQLQSDMLINQLQSGVEASAFVLPKDISTAYMLFKQSRDIKYGIVPYKRFIGQVHTNSEALQNYYKQNQDQFRTVEQVSINYIRLSLADIAKKQKITEAELQQYYSDNKASYAAPARWHVAQILIRESAKPSAEQRKVVSDRLAKISDALKAGQTFSAVAKKYSDDIASRNQGGVLPWFTAGTLDPAFEKAVSQLKVGEVSQPVKTRFGVNIIKLLADKAQKQRPFADVKKQVEQRLRQEKAQKSFAEESEQLSNLTFSDSTDLTAAAKALHLPIQSTGLFSKQGTKSGLAMEPRIINAAFGATVLQQDYNSDPIQLRNGDIVVLRLRKHQAAAVKPYTQVKSKIKHLLILNAAKMKAQALGQQLISAIKNNKTPQQVLLQHQVRLLSAHGVTRHNNKIKASIVNLAFSLPKPIGRLHSPVGGVALADGDYAVVMVTKVVAGDTHSMSQGERKAFKQQLAKAYGSMDYGLFVKQQLSNAKTD